MLLTCPSLDINGWFVFHIIGIYTVFSSMVASMHCNSLPPQDNFLILCPVILSEFSCGVMDTLRSVMEYNSRITNTQRRKYYA